MVPPLGAAPPPHSYIGGKTCLNRFPPPGAAPLLIVE